MKRLTKTLIATTAVLAVSASMAAFAGCSSSTTGEAYALTHSDGQYVSKATVTVNGDDITEATITEVYTPIRFTAEAVDGDYTVTDGSSIYYKTVKYGDVTLTYSADNSDYMVGSVTMTEYFKTEANAKAYYEAVVSNSVAVVLAEDNYTIITNTTANKDENGYWTREGADGNNYSRWQANRNATIAYVVEYDSAAFGTLTKSETAEADTLGGSSEVYYWYDANNINTGATWSDMSITDSTRAATGYIQLLQNAYNAAK